MYTQPHEQKIRQIEACTIQNWRISRAPKKKLTFTLGSEIVTLPFNEARALCGSEKLCHVRNILLV